MCVCDRRADVRGFSFLPYVACCGSSSPADDTSRAHVLDTLLSELADFHALLPVELVQSHDASEHHGHGDCPGFLPALVSGRS